MNYPTEAVFLQDNNYNHNNGSTGHPLVAQAIAPGVWMSSPAKDDLASKGIVRIVNRELWLMVAVTPTRMFVYRSLLLPVEHEWYRQVRELAGDSAPLVQVVIPDPGMMFGHAEHSIYPMREGWWEG